MTAAKIGAAAASHGNHVPATQGANNAVFLRNDNTWQSVTFQNIAGIALNTSGVNNVANQVARTQGNGHLMCGYINTNTTTEAQTISRIFFEQGSDGYIRKCTPAHFCSQMGTPRVVYSASQPAYEEGLIWLKPV